MVTVNQGQETLLSSWMKTIATSISKTWVKSLANNVVFQVGGTIDASPGKYTHYHIIPLVEKTLLLQINQL